MSARKTAEQRIDVAFAKLVGVGDRVEYVRADRSVPVPLASLVEALEGGVDGAVVAVVGFGRVVGRVAVKALA